MNWTLDALSPISVGFISLGCAKNLVDSQVMAGSLISDDIRLAPSPEDAEIVIVNTCAFIEEAREESLDSIRYACELKETGPCLAVIVAGCYPQRYREQLQQDLPQVDAVIGLDQLEEISHIARRLAQGERNIYEVSGNSTKVFDPRLPGLVFTGGPYAYLKIAEGCNHRCGFCAIPGIRGRYRSRSLSSVRKEAEQLLDRGIRELNIISQDVTCYGTDLKDGTDLAGLLQELGSIGGEFWIRLLYGYPSRLTDGLLSTMAAIPQVCRYLDVPIQHSHPEILKAMLRADTVKPVMSVAPRVRAVMPDVVLRTTCLVGFPGETEEHISHLLEFIKETRFDHLGVFTFSPEEGTHAMGLPDHPAPAVAEERRERLMLAQKEIVDAKAAAIVGTEAEVLLENRIQDRESLWVGRSRRDAPEIDGEVLVSNVEPDNHAGDFIHIRYTAPDEYDMKATQVK